jgi:hypothetical protein
MHTDNNQLVTYNPKQIDFKPGIGRDEWAEIHRNILLARHASRAWLKQSREFAEKQWGAEYVGQVEIQCELALGLPQPAEKPKLNPADKSKAIITIEGISQSFSMWSRKMRDEIETWEKARLQKALELLEPMEKQARRIRELLQ